MFKVFPITLDVTKKQLNEMFQVNSNDLNTIKVLVTIKSDLIPFDIAGKTVRLAVKKPDGLSVFQDGSVTDGGNGVCEFVLDNQAYIAEGMHEAEVMIFDGEIAVAVTQKFFYKVNRAILNNETIESSNEFSAIHQAIIAGEQLQGVDIPAIVTAAEDAETQAIYAMQQGNYAMQEAERAKDMTEAADLARMEAEEAALNVGTAAANATEQAAYAKAQGDAAKMTADSIKTKWLPSVALSPLIII